MKSLFAMAVALTLTACGRGEMRPEYPQPPKPSNVVAQYEFKHDDIYEVDVTEFRDSLGRTCVFVAYSYEGALDCDWPRDLSGGPE